MSALPDLTETSTPQFPRVGHGVRHWAAALLAITGIGLALRLWRLEHQSLWMDEVLTVTRASNSLADILTKPSLDRNLPPLHNAIVYLVRSTLGTSDALMRLPSAIAGGLTIPALYAAARPLVGERIGLVSALLLAVSPFHLWYSQEARPYAFLALFAVVAAWCAQQFVERPTASGWLIGFSAAAAASLYTHVIAAPALGALSVYIVAKIGPRARAKALGGLILLGVLLLPLAVRFMAVPPSASSNPSYRLELAHAGYTLWAFATGYSLGPSTLELRRGIAGLSPHLAVVIPVLGLLVGLAWLGSYHLWRTRRGSCIFLVLSVVLPIASAMVGAAVTVHSYNARYAILAAPGFVILCAAGIVALPTSGTRALALVAVVLVEAVAIANYYFVPKYHREDNRSAVSFLNRHALPGELVIASAGYTALPLRYYELRPDLELAPYPRSGLVVPGKLPKDLARLIGERERAWLFLSRTFHSDPSGEIVRYMGTHLKLTAEFAAPGVRVLLYTRAQ